MIKVRPAIIDDADALCDAHVAGWRIGYAHVFSREFLWSDDFEANRRAQWRGWTWGEFGVRSELFAGLASGRVVGFSHCGAERDEAGDGTGVVRGEVYGFYVHPDSWGSGVATALMDRSVEQLRADGYPSAVLWVLDDNPRARAFYERAGWSPTGRTDTFTPAGHDPVGEVEYARLL